MPKLTDFDPRWVDLGDRRGLGFLFRCTTGHCQDLNIVLFANPLDSGPALEGNTWPVFEKLEAAGLIGDDRRLHRGCGLFRWNREPDTTTFEDLTLTPSVDAHECGHFVLSNGRW
jgi:hypothetical protein